MEKTPVSVCSLCLSHSKSNYRSQDCIVPSQDERFSGIDELRGAMEDILKNKGDTNGPVLVCSQCNAEFQQIFAFIYRCSENTPIQLKNAAIRVKKLQDRSPKKMRNHTVSLYNFAESRHKSCTVSGAKADSSSCNFEDSQDEQHLQRLELQHESLEDIRIENNPVVESLLESRSTVTRVLGDLKKFTCNPCGREFISLSSLKAHSRRHPEKNFKCNHCGRELATKYSLARHQRLHEKQVEKVLEECTKKIMAPIEDIETETDLSEVHSDENNLNSCRENSLIKLKFTNDIQTQSDIAMSSFEERPQSFEIKDENIEEISINNYQIAETLVAAETILASCKEQRLDNVALEMKSEGNSEKQLTQLIAGTEYQHHKLNAHVPGYHKSTGPKRLYKCVKCGARFWRKFSLYAHLNVHGDKTFSCIMCNSKFSSHSCLLYHHFTHLKKKLKCDQCDKEFDNLKNFKQHREIHAGQILICNHCQRIFRTKRGLAAHKRIQHFTQRSNDSQQFICDQCEKKFNNPYSLKAHLNRHGKAIKNDQTSVEDESKKNVCYNQGANNKQEDEALPEIPTPTELHLRGKDSDKNNSNDSLQYNDIKPFACAECKQAFDNPCSLRAHVRIHVGRVFQCNQCSAKYRTKWKLRQHQWEHNTKIVTSIDQSPNVSEPDSNEHDSSDSLKISSTKQSSETSHDLQKQIIAAIFNNEELKDRVDSEMPSFDDNTATIPASKEILSTTNSLNNQNTRNLQYPIKDTVISRETTATNIRDIQKQIHSSFVINRYHTVHKRRIYYK